MPDVDRRSLRDQSPLGLEFNTSQEQVTTSDVGSDLRFSVTANSNSLDGTITGKAGRAYRAGPRSASRRGTFPIHPTNRHSRQRFSDRGHDGVRTAGVRRCRTPVPYAAGPPRRVGPGGFFEVSDHVRIGLCGETAVLREGLSRLGECLTTLRATPPVDTRRGA